MLMEGESEYNGVTWVAAGIEQKLVFAGRLAGIACQKFEQIG